MREWAYFFLPGFLAGAAWLYIVQTGVHIYRTIREIRRLREIKEKMR